ncbi:MAG: NADH-quinone oxidoreductase subunit NuoK [Coriobacteriia bacterium]|nr:NADH-quinone oxidoreductase subunit NuoK [Coriobacteriia bacterium]
MHLNLAVNYTAVILLAAALFVIGLYGVLTRKSAIGILLSLELMSMAIMINLITMGHFVNPSPLNSWFFTIFLMVIVASEVGIGLALIIAIYRSNHTSEVDDLDRLKG